MSPKITEEQVEKLFQFCRDHYVPFYDLQVELVDHMASSIEDQWRSDPDLTFDKALANSFKSFGVYGFSRIKRLKIKEMNRINRRIISAILSVMLVALGFLLYIDLFILPVKVKEKFMTEYGKFALN